MSAADLLDMRRPEWQQHAACRGHLDVISAVNTVTGSPKQHVVEAAAALCGRCPVFDECREYAEWIPDPERPSYSALHGLFAAGETHDHRWRRLRRERVENRNNNEEQRTA